MDTSIQITKLNLDEEIETVWLGVCQVLGCQPNIIKKPEVKWAEDRTIDLAVPGAIFATLDPGKRTIFLSYERDVYRNHLAHEMAHYLRWHLAKYDESEYWPIKVDEEIGRV